MNRQRIPCRDIAKHLCEELDERLDSASCRKIRRHLQECPNCAAYLDSLKKTVRLYASYPSPHVPALCRKRLSAALTMELRSRPRKR
jgi:hypothetical protein